MASTTTGSIDLVVLGDVLERHVEEVGDVVQVVVGVDLGMPDGLLVDHGADGWHLGQHPADGHQLLLPTAVGVQRLGIEGRQRADHGDQLPHRVGTRGVGREDVGHVFVDQGLMADLLIPGGQLLLGGQLAVDQQVTHLDKRGLFSQLLDAVPAIAQNPLFAIQEGDAAGGGTGVLVADVQRDEPALTAQFADVQRAFPFGAFNNGELVGFFSEFKDSGLCHAIGE
jgi:hypothetical protein